ncbi:hypothetical protein DRH29_02730 [candidate division Kazan bacterium]|uniref:Uncharacterized protein n=1 Tax=candidate division Kazan bacterium TaxID=2202143 RepID=A0A420ZCL0_UNCK3|nr:MAG: hypothetical protein DRH29_02730 [candidate division Kazan bacterium]
MSGQKLITVKSLNTSLKTNQVTINFQLVIQLGCGDVESIQELKTTQLYWSLLHYLVQLTFIQNINTLYQENGFHLAPPLIKDLGEFLLEQLMMKSKRKHGCFMKEDFHLQ